MIKRQLGVDMKVTVKLTKDSFNEFEEIRESVYRALEKDLRKALRRAGFLSPKIRII